MRLPFVFIFITSLIFSNPIDIKNQDVHLCYDLDMSGYAGGEDLIFSTRVLETVSNQLTPILDQKLTSKAAQLGLRAIDLVGIFLPLNYFASVVQHEVFGHGYRIRDLGTSKAKVHGYDFSWPPPYGDGDGTTYYGIHPKNISLNELSSIFQAGIESQNILAWITKTKWLSSEYVDPKQSVLFLVSLFALNLYGSETDDAGNFFDGHDLTNYVESVNAAYPQAKLKVSSLRNLGLINLLDITSLASIYAWTEFLLYNKTVKTWMIPIQKWHYLPSFRMGLSPFGPEIYFDNFLKKSDLIYFYIKAGNSSKQSYLGAGLWANQLYSLQKFKLSLRADFWSQPRLALNGAQTLINYEDYQENSKARSCGAAISGIITYPNQGKSSVIGEFGWKSEGFLPGYSLFSAPVVRVSIAAQF